jgi:hypothetical protein
MTRLRRAYGAGPLHLLGALASLGLAAYALARIFAGVQPWNVMLWLVGAIVAHDVIAFWSYTALDRVARGLRVRGVNYVRVPAVLSGLALIVYFPLILGLGRYERATTLSQGVYLGRWLALTCALFVGSAIVFAVRALLRR